MTTTEQRLADALRAMLDDPESLPAMRAGGEALAAYDAQQVVGPSDGAWRVEQYRKDAITIVTDDYVLCGAVAILEIGITASDSVKSAHKVRATANAARIVQCVNAHDGLVSALRNIADAEPPTPNQFAEGWNTAHAKLCGYARAALAAAGVRHA